MRHIWSERRWSLQFVSARKGSGKDKNGRSHSRVLQYRLHPIDTTRYPPERLVQIRARERNHRGEIQR